MLMEKMNIMQSHTKKCKSFVCMFSHDSTPVTAKYHLIARGISLMPAQVFLNGNCQLINHWINHQGQLHVNDNRFNRKFNGQIFIYCNPLNKCNECRKKLNFHSVTYNPHTKSKYINQNTANCLSNYSQSNPQLPRGRTARPRQAV